VAARRTVLIDDRLLIDELLVGLGVRSRQLMTTTYWYYRAVRAARAAAGGQLFGPFLGLPAALQDEAVGSLLSLPEQLLVADARRVVPAMADVAVRHPRLNLLNVEVTAAALVHRAEVWLSPPSAEGVLPDVLESERIPWKVREPR
jgi:hypothetical protein